MEKLDNELQNETENLITEEKIEDKKEPVLKEYQKLLLEDMKRKETVKALDEVKLGLFEQKTETEFDFSNYNSVQYGKKYKGLYTLYQNKETFELAFVCPLIENNKGDDNERTDLKPYAYDVLYLDYLDEEAYELVKKAAIHEKSRWIDVFYYMGISLYFVLLALNLITIVMLLTMKSQFAEYFLLCSTLWSCQIIMTVLLPIMAIEYRKYKAR